MLGRRRLVLMVLALTAACGSGANKAPVKDGSVYRPPDDLFTGATDEDLASGGGDDGAPGGDGGEDGGGTGGADGSPSGDAFVPLACAPKVNEVQTTGATGVSSDEFVELYNPCSGTIALDGWKLAYRSATNNSGGKDTLLFDFGSSGMTIGSMQWLVFGGAMFTGADGKLASGLKDTGGAVGLRDPGGNLVDSVAYGKLTGTNLFTESTAAVAPANGKSIARVPDGHDTDDNQADFLDGNPTPGTSN